VIGLDTNVVVRYLVHDNPGQSAVASALIDELTETDPGYLSVVTVVEIYWVLRRVYKVGCRAMRRIAGRPLGSAELRAGQDVIVRAALVANRGGLDFADAVIAELGKAAGCLDTVTLDEKAARHGAMKLPSHG
jgi:predicted nucleic-acid-binding protein